MTAACTPLHPCGLPGCDWCDENGLAPGHANGDEPDPPPHPADPGQLAREDGPLQLDVVEFKAFGDIDEPGAGALLGDDSGPLIPIGGDVMVYGPGGSGKTTLTVDLGCHLGAGADWLTMTVPSPWSVLLVENEGPRPQFRAKVRAKVEAWASLAMPSFAGRLRIVADPWAKFTFTSEAHRIGLANEIQRHDVDLVIVGPTVMAGMIDAGTLAEVRSFLGLVHDVRHRCGRLVAFMLVHHPNRAGQVSGAWEGAVDTLLHVAGQGHGATRLHIQKARWCSGQHGRTLELRWEDGAGFSVATTPTMSDDDIAAAILQRIDDDPGIGWSKVDKTITGVRTARKMTIRDRLLVDGRIVNVVRQDGRDVAVDRCDQGRRTRLYRADDPTIRQLRPDPEEVGKKLSSAGVLADPETSSLLPVRSREEGREEVSRGAPDPLEPSLLDTLAHELGATAEETP